MAALTAEYWSPDDPLGHAANAVPETISNTTKLSINTVPTRFITSLLQTFVNKLLLLGNTTNMLKKFNMNAGYPA
ncbi:MAG: hypothetical protein M1309_04340 [Actinobacteria bacterium]|nr:hypothetical protein [Actinomycetota bacterium]